MELFKQRAGVFLVHIPFQGTAPALQNVLGGQVQIYFTNISDVVSHVQSGKLRGLAVSDEKRSGLLPAVPTFAEQGFPGFVSYSWYGMVAPAGTPEPVLRRIYEAVAFALSAPDVRERLEKQGQTIMNGDGAALQRFMREEQARYAEPIKRSGARIE